MLGITSIGDLLADLGQEVVFATEEVCRACDEPESGPESRVIEDWLRETNGSPGWASPTA